MRPQAGVNKKFWFIILVLAIGLFSCYSILAPKLSPNFENAVSPTPEQITPVAKAEPIPEYLDYLSPFKNFPLPDTLNYEERSLRAEYYADSSLCDRVQLYLRRHRPEVGVFIVSDLETGRILAFGERIDSAESYKAHLIFGKEYPAASLAKTVTALAAIKEGISANDSLVQIGSYHTLYKRQLSPQPHDNFPQVSLKKAFAKSINPAFGLLAQKLGGEKLNAAASQLMWNKNYGEPLRIGSFYHAPDSGYHLAEVGCGFTQKLTITPLHALEIARAVGGDGKWKPSHFARLASISNRDSLPIQNTNIDLSKNSSVSENFPSIFSPMELAEMKMLWMESCNRGTARKGFHKIMRRSHLEQIHVGAKTGSLDGPDPEGRYDWFMGYASLKDNPKKGIAISIMQVHQSYQSLRSTYIAALLIKDWLNMENRRQKELEESLAEK